MKKFHTFTKLFAIISSALLLLIAEPGMAQVTSGTGTNGKIPLWTGPHSQGNSVMTQSGNKIGIGTAAPTSPLSVWTTTTTPAIYARATTNGQAVLGVSNTGYGVRGGSVSAIGVVGFSTSGNGITGTSVDKVGVFGVHTATTGIRPGVEGATSSTAFDSVGVLGIAAKGYAVQGQSTDGLGGYFSCVNNYAGYFTSTHSDAADFLGASWGIYVRNSGNQPAVDGGSSGANSYAGYFYSGAYRSGYIKSGNAGNYSLYVDTQDGPTQGTAGLDVNGSLRAEGSLYVAGSKAGYVVDEMQNADAVALEQGDVVVIAADSGTPVLGQIPVPRIKLATSANDTAVVGVVDEMMYVPDDATRFAYEAQQKADHDAASQSQTLSNSGQGKLSPTANIQNRISDEVGTLHADRNAARALPSRYCSVVTLGAYKAVKADASYGAIRAGDLLTTSPHAGYAMKVNDKASASGAIIGKALSSLNSGFGTVSVLVTLK